LSNYYRIKVEDSTNTEGWRWQKVPGYATSVAGLAATRHFTGMRGKQPLYDDKFVLTHYHTGKVLTGSDGRSLLFIDRGHAQRFAGYVSDLGAWDTIDVVMFDKRSWLEENVARAYDYFTSPLVPLVENPDVVALSANDSVDASPPYTVWNPSGVTR